MVYMIIAMCLFYLFMGSFTFMVLEKKRIGFSEYWYPAPPERLESLYNDKTLFWSLEGVLLSTIWPITLFILFSSFAASRIIKWYENNYQDK